MVNVSKKLLESDVFQKISGLLVTHIIRMKTKQRAKELLYELLTPAERAQIAKRFAIITMLHRNHTTSDIENTLSVSRTTIGKIEEAMERGSYTSTVRELKRASRGDLVVALDTLIEFSLRKGGGRGLHKVNRAINSQYRHVPKKRECSS